VFEQTPFYTVVSDDEIVRALKMMGKPQDLPLDHRTAMEVCVRVGSAALLEGSISIVGEQYVVALSAVDCGTGKLLSEKQEYAFGKNKVLQSLGAMTQGMREKLGESIREIDKFNTPLEDVTTGSVEALHAYTLGFRTVSLRDDDAGAIPFFEQAIRLDPDFAMAYARLANALSNLSEDARARIIITEAYKRRDRLSLREQLFIESKYEFIATGDLLRAEQYFIVWQQMFPQDPIPPGNLNVIYYYLGDYERALKSALAFLRLNPGSGLAYSNVVWAYINLNRLAEANRIAAEALHIQPDFKYVHLPLYLISFLENDTEKQQTHVRSVLGRPGLEEFALYYQADTAAYFGRFEQARQLTEEAVAAAIRAKERETAGTFYAEAALRESVVQNWSQVDRFCESALHLSNGRDVIALVGLALALKGDRVSANRYEQDLAERFPQDTVTTYIYRPLIQGAADLNREGLAQNALNALNVALPYDLASPTVVNIALYTAYLRGYAAMSVKNWRMAIAEFQKIIDHKGVVLNEPIGALAKLGLARALLHSGERAKARGAYNEFMNLWKNCDPTVPICVDATMEARGLK
jgi:tetratricopeptide (TPR) repeat protein